MTLSTEWIYGKYPAIPCLADMSFPYSESIMKTSRIFTWTLCALAAATFLSAGTAMAQKRDEPVQTIPAPRNMDPAMVELGKKLFFDPRLSKSGFISCNSCHNLSMGGSDNLKTSIGHNWSQGPINSPTVLK